MFYLLTTEPLISQLVRTFAVADMTKLSSRASSTVPATSYATSRAPTPALTHSQNTSRAPTPALQVVRKVSKPVDVKLEVCTLIVSLCFDPLSHGL
jgi:hypothetical protein